MVSEVWTSVVYHREKPDLYREVKIALPVTLSSSFYVHFTVMHVRCSPKKPYEQVRPATPLLRENTRPTDLGGLRSPAATFRFVRAADVGPRHSARVQLQAGAVSPGVSDSISMPARCSRYRTKEA